jgi:hypothetical protein
MYSYINIYTNFKKYVELIEKLPSNYFVNILLSNTNKYINPENTFIIMFSEESKHNAIQIRKKLIREGFASVIYSDYIITNDRIYMKVI